MKSLADLRGISVQTLQKWENLDLHFQRVARIDYDKCIGCNRCALVCPVDDCITMVEIPNGKASMTWSNYQDKLANGQMQPIPPHP